MPFAHPLRAFTRADIESLNQSQNGVYGIFSNGVCIYVGRGDIRARLLAHLNGENTCISGQRPTQWTGEVRADDVAREKELIVELAPRCNQKVG